MEREGHTRQQDEKGHPTMVAKFCLKTDTFSSEHLSGHQLVGQLRDVVGWELVPCPEHWWVLLCCLLSSSRAPWLRTGLSPVPVPCAHHTLPFSNTAGLPAPSEGEEERVAGGRKERSPGPASGSEESQVTLGSGRGGQQLWGYLVVGEPEQISVSPRPRWTPQL